MMGDESMHCRSGSRPTSTGHVPTFAQLSAAARNSSGGSSREINSPFSTVRIVCVEIRDLRRTSSREKVSVEYQTVSFVIWILYFQSRGANSLTPISNLPVRAPHQ